MKDNVQKRNKNDLLLLIVMLDSYKNSLTLGDSIFEKKYYLYFFGVKNEVSRQVKIFYSLH